MSDKRNFWLIPQNELLQRVENTPKGINEAQGKIRKARYGPNIIVDQKKLPLIVKLLGRFKNPLIILLLVASILSAFVGDRNSAIIILLIMTVSVALDFIQEYRAGKAAEKLRQSFTLKTTVLRDGKETEIYAIDVVPGDIVKVFAGGLIIAFFGIVPSSVKKLWI